MADMAALVVQLELQQAQFLEGMQKATASIEKAAESSKKTHEAIAALGEKFSSVATKAYDVGKAILTWKGFEEIAKAGEHVQQLTAQFDALLGSSSLAADMMDHIDEIAAHTAQPTDAVASNIRRMAIALGETGTSNATIAALVENITKLGSISGASTEQTASTVAAVARSIQLGTVSARQFRELMTDAPALVRTVATELGKSTAELANMAKQGELSGTTIANALLDASRKTDEAFAKLPMTYSAGQTVLKNGWGLVAGVNRQGHESLEHVRSNLCLHW